MPPYFLRLSRAVANLHRLVPTHGNGMALIGHEPWCPHWQHGTCTCLPLIELQVTDRNATAYAFRADANGELHPIT